MPGGHSVLPWGMSTLLWRSDLTTPMGQLRLREGWGLFKGHCKWWHRQTETQVLVIRGSPLTPTGACGGNAGWSVQPPAPLLRVLGPQEHLSSWGPGQETQHLLYSVLYGEQHWVGPKSRWGRVSDEKFSSFPHDRQSLDHSDQGWVVCPLCTK